MPCEAKIPVGAVDVVSAPNQNEVVARFAFIRELDSCAVNAIDEGLKILPPMHVHYRAPDVRPGSGALLPEAVKAGVLCPYGAPLIAWRAKCQGRVTHNDKAFLFSLRRWDAFKGRCVKLRQEFDRGSEDGEGACSFVDELKAMADVILLRSQE